MLWVLLPVFLFTSSISRAQGPEKETALAEARRLNEEAVASYRAGKYSQAEALIERSLAIREKVLGPEHPDVAQSLENYAALLRKTNREAESARMEARAKAIRAMHSQKNPAK